MEEDCCSTQLIDGAGVFNEAGLEDFMKIVKLADRGLSYAVVSIMGPQSSGKSTLLNHLFHTNFREMDTFKGRTQTTQGIWMARAPNIDPCTLVMDLEGSDGRERGEDDTTFEKQSALFALAVSDIVLINMWCHDIGREQAANKPLLKTVFQVMMRLFSPRKTTLMFVIRDKTKTPLEVLEPILREDIQKIWDNIPKPPQHKGTPLSEFFNVEVTALPSYELQEKDFKEKVMELRHRFFNSIAPGGLAGDRTGVVPASAFPFSTKQIWTVIRDNKDLDLPAHKVMVATVRCEELAKEKFQLLKSDEVWLELERDVQSGPVKNFGKRISTILDKYFSEYDAEAAYFDEGVRKAKREQLISNSLNLVYPAYQTLLSHLCSKSLDLFKRELEQALNKGEGFAASVRNCEEKACTEFDKESEGATVQQASWDSGKVREQLCCDIDNHTASVRSKKLLEITEQFQKHLTDVLSEPIATLLESGSRDTWPAIRKLFKMETERAVSDFSSAIDGFEIDDATENEMVENLKIYARSVVEKKVREEASHVLSRMKERFSNIFTQDAEGMPRVWTGKEDIRAITKDARSKSLKLLASMAAFRLEDRPDNVEKVLSSALLDSGDASGAKQDRSISTVVTSLASSTWEEVPPSDTIITPAQCKSIWRQFKTETEYTVGQAITAQEASKRSNSYLPPPWAIVALLILGFNEFMMLLRNPLYLGVIFVLFLLGKALWIQLDVPGVFQHGAISGILQLSTKFLPTVMGMLKRLADEGYKASTSNNNGHANGLPPTVPSSTSSSKVSSSASNLTSSSSYKED